jgi:hypothetical protein
MHESELHPGMRVSILAEAKDLTSDIYITPGSILEVVRYQRPSTVILKYYDTFVTLELKYLHRIE